MAWHVKNVNFANEKRFPEASRNVDSAEQKIGKNGGQKDKEKKKVGVCKRAFVDISAWSVTRTALGPTVPSDPLTTRAIRAIGCRHLMDAAVLKRDAFKSSDCCAGLKLFNYTNLLILSTFIRLDIGKCGRHNFIKILLNHSQVILQL